MNLAKSVALQRATAQIQVVDFDINNQEHLDAFAQLARNNRQHPTIRFRLKSPYHDVRSMIAQELMHAYLDKVVPKNQ